MGVFYDQTRNGSHYLKHNVGFFECVKTRSMRKEESENVESKPLAFRKQHPQKKQHEKI